MKDYISELIKDKKVLILGFGREGRSSFQLFKNVGGFFCLDVADGNPTIAEEKIDAKIIAGPQYLDVIDEYDIVMKSPGIVLPREISDYKAMITCQIDLFMHEYGRQTVGITGTKGKSTTSTLLYHVLKESGRNTILAGNIGIPVFDILDQIEDETIIVVELSCHQLEYNHFAPHMAALLNFYEDHLDHYGTYEKYCNAKRNIYRNQKENDLFFVRDEFTPSADEYQSTLKIVAASHLPFVSWSDFEGGAPLRGEHNKINAAFVYDICKCLGVTDSEYMSAIASYKTLPHRLEYLGQKNGVEFFDDSISTTCESAISAMKSIENCGAILLGGMDRGIDYEPLIEYLLTSSPNHVICMYDSGKKLFDLLSNRMTVADKDKLYYASTLEEACSYAKRVAEVGSAVILSPAAASYGVFKNFEERGDKFKEYVMMN